MKFEIPRRQRDAKTVKEIAKEAGCSAVTVYRWLAGFRSPLEDEPQITYTMVRRGKSGPEAKAYYRRHA